MAFDGFHSNILLAFRDQGLSSNLVQFLQVDASGLEHFSPDIDGVEDEIYHSLTVSKVDDNDPTNYDNIRNYGNADEYISLARSIYLSDINENQQDQFLYFVNKHFRQISKYNFNDISNNETGNTIYNNMTSEEKETYIHNMNYERVALVLDNSGGDTRGIEKMLKLYRDLRDDFYKIAPATDISKQVMDISNVKSEINQQVRDKVVSTNPNGRYINNASTRIFGDYDGIRIIGDADKLEDEISKKQESVVASIFNTFVEDYFRKMYNDCVECKKNGDTNILVVEANDTSGADYRVQHSKDYWIEDIMSCKVTDASSVQREFHVGDENYIERFLHFLINGPGETDGFNNNIDSSGSILDGFELVDDNENFISKYIDPSKKLGGTNKDVKFRSMILRNVSNIDTVEKYSRIGCTEDLFWRIDHRNIRKNTFNYLKYKNTDENSAFISQINEKYDGDDIEKGDGNSVSLDISGGIEDNGLMHLVGYGYYAFDGSNNDLSGSELSTDINDSVTFYIRSRINSIFKSDNADGIQSLFGMTKDKIVNFVKRLKDNEDNEIIVSESGGTRALGDGNTGKYKDDFSLSVDGISDASDYASGPKNRFFSVARGDNCKLLVMDGGNRKVIEFSQNWLLLVRLNSKKE